MPSAGSPGASASQSLSTRSPLCSSQAFLPCTHWECSVLSGPCSPGSLIPGHNHPDAHPPLHTHPSYQCWMVNTSRKCVLVQTRTCSGAWVFQKRSAQHLCQNYILITQLASLMSSINTGFITGFCHSDSLLLLPRQAGVLHRD